MPGRSSRWSYWLFHNEIGGYIMQTLHTEIKGKDCVNAPSSYEVIHKNSGNVVNVIAFQRGPILDRLNGIFLRGSVIH